MAISARPFAQLRDSIRVQYECSGPETGELVLLVSGAGAPLEFWHPPFCQRIACAGYRVARYSHRDTGLSDHFDQPYSIGELLKDLIALVTALGYDRAHLVGHSMGGYLVQMAAAYHPNLVVTATSLAAGPGTSAETVAELGLSQVAEDTWDILMRNEPSGDFDADIDGWMRSWKHLNGCRPFDRALAVDYTRSLYVGDRRNCQVAVNHIHAMSTVPSSLVRELGNCRCPFLVIHGNRDPLVPIDHGRATHARVKDARMQVLDGVGHMFFDAAIWDELADSVVHHLGAARDSR